MSAIFNIVDFGAVGDGVASCTSACRLAAEACRDAGGGTILVPEGHFVSGIFEIYSRTVLHVAKGGRLVGSPTIEEHVFGSAIGGLLYARDAADIRLEGEGVLDGNGPRFFLPGDLHVSDDFSYESTRQGRAGVPFGSKEWRHGPRRPEERPGNLLVFARCQRLIIEGLTLTGAPYWTIHCSDCEEVTIRGLKIDNDPSFPNNDGIHLTTCRRAKIESCDIASGDDCIAITGFNHPGGERQIALGFSGIVGACEDITIRDCRLSSRSSAIRIGYGVNPVRNVRISNIQIIDSNRGIGIYARQSDVEDVEIRNCTISTRLFHGNWWGRGEPIQISAIRFTAEGHLFEVRNVRIIDVVARGENAVTFFSEEQGAIRGVRLERVQHHLALGELFAEWGGNLELRPSASRSLAIHEGGTAPLWSIGVADLDIQDCRWSIEAGSEDILCSGPIVR